MHLRIVCGQAQPGPASEFARRWKEFFLHLRDETGVRRALFAGDRGANTTIAISLWDTLPDESMTRRWRAYRAQ